MLLDPETLDLTGVAAQILRGGGRVKLELPAAQLEVATAPAASVDDAIAELAVGRRELAEMAAGIARPAAAGVHPFAAPIGALNAGERYDAILADYGDVARSQQVCALQVHVALGSADATLAVYNALRGHLPELAALAANAPFHAGRDTGLASVRPLIGGLLPRQGVPPAIPSWEAFAEMLSWARANPASGGGSCARTRRSGRSRCGSATRRRPSREAAAVASFAHALVAWLARAVRGRRRAAARRRRGGSPRTAGWRAGRASTVSFADLVTGERRSVREVLRERMEQVGCDVSAGAQRGDAPARGRASTRAAGWLADRFLSGPRAPTGT